MYGKVEHSWRASDFQSASLVVCSGSSKFDEPAFIKVCFASNVPWKMGLGQTVVGNIELNKFILVFSLGTS